MTREELIEKITEWEMNGQTSGFAIPAYHWQLEMIKEVVNDAYDVEVTGEKEHHFLNLVTIRKKKIELT